VAGTHEMVRIKLFILSRNESYRDTDGGLVKRRLKNMSKRAYDDLRNKVDAAWAPDALKILVQIISI
jgi:hypothetical protein